MNWKQPIPTKIEGLSRKETAVMQRILLRCANKPIFVKIEEDEIELKRGQCILGRYEFAQEFLLHKSESLRVYRIVLKLQKVNKLLNISRHKYCSVVTVINYEEYVSLEHLNEQLVNNWRTTGEQLANTNKSVKSDKSDKNNNNTISFSHNKKESKTLDWLINHRDEVIAKLQKDHPDKDVAKGYKYFLRLVEIKNYDYEDYYEALRNWIDEDRYNQFSLVDNKSNK